MTNVFDYVAVFQDATEAFASQDVEAVVQMFAADCVLTDSDDPVRLWLGRDAVRAALGAIRETEGDLHPEHIDVVIDPESLRAEFSARRTREGPCESSERRYRLSDLTH